jgi:hypothetical protein
MLRSYQRISPGPWHFETFRNNRNIFTVRGCRPHAQPPSWRTIPCRLSVTAYSIYSQLPSVPWGLPSIHNLRTRHAVVPGTHLTWLVVYTEFYWANLIIGVILKIKNMAEIFKNDIKLVTKVDVVKKLWLFGRHFVISVRRLQTQEHCWCWRRWLVLPFSPQWNFVLKAEEKCASGEMSKAERKRKKCKLINISKMLRLRSYEFCTKCYA